jgi:hypothetical protein
MSGKRNSKAGRSTGANPGRVARVQELRRSNAAGSHGGRRPTRAAAKRAAVAEYR